MTNLSFWFEWVISISIWSVNLFSSPPPNNLQLSKFHHNCISYKTPPSKHIQPWPSPVINIVMIAHTTPFFLMSPPTPRYILHIRYPWSRRRDADTYLYTTILSPSSIQYRRCWRGEVAATAAAWARAPGPEPDKYTRIHADVRRRRQQQLVVAAVVLILVGGDAAP